MLSHARLRLEAVRGSLQRPQCRRAVRHGGGGSRRRPEMPGRGRHRLAKVSEVLRNKLERDLGDAEERATVRAGILAEVEGAAKGTGRRKGEVYLIYDRPHKVGTRTHVRRRRRPKVMPRPDTFLVSCTFLQALSHIQLYSLGIVLETSELTCKFIVKRI